MAAIFFAASELPAGHWKNKGAGTAGAGMKGGIR